MSAPLTPGYEAEIRTKLGWAARDFGGIDYVSPTFGLLRDTLAELDRVRAELAARPTRAEVLRQEADEIVAYCPVHSPWDEAWMDCHCDVADEMRRRADKAAPGVTAR